MRTDGPLEIGRCNGREAREGRHAAAAVDGSAPIYRRIDDTVPGGPRVAARRYARDARGDVDVCCVGILSYCKAGAVPVALPCCSLLLCSVRHVFEVVSTFEAFVRSILSERESSILSDYYVGTNGYYFFY